MKLMCALQKEFQLCAAGTIISQSQSALILEQNLIFLEGCDFLIIFFFCWYLCFHICSDEENDEDPDSIYYLPVAPEIDDPEETGWTQEV